MLKNKVVEMRKMRKCKISNDKFLYATIIEMCCNQNIITNDLVLRGDEFVKIIAPYFKICELHLKVKII